MQGFVLTQTDQGAVQWRLHAQRATLQDAGGDVTLQEPEMELFQTGTEASKKSKDRDPTKVKSRNGVFLQSSGDIRLTGDVVVVSHEDPSQTTILKTQALDYSSAKEEFRTDLPVVIDRGASRMRGTGMTANRDLSEIHVFHQEASLQ